MTRPSIFQGALWRIRGLTVFALIGKSGSGKSFRAKLIADKFKISYIIDDGLLIKGNAIIAGKSAKNERLFLDAVRTAVFHDPAHLAEMRHKISEEKIRRLLILGTSEKMIRIVTKRLDVPYPERILRIEDYASETEIQTALDDRMKGRHVIPVPALELQKNYASLFLDSIKVILKRGFFSILKPKSFYKSVVRPAFLAHGGLTISETALRQLILHCVDEFNPNFTVERCFVKKNKKKYRIQLFLGAHFGLQLSGEVQNLQKYIFEMIERYTGIQLDEICIQICKLK